MGHVAWALCARCGKQIELQQQSRPAGVATCRGCWREESAEAARRTAEATAAWVAAVYERECAWCGSPFATRLSIQVFCAKRCQWNAKKAAPCVRCGKLMARGRGSRPAGQGVCQPCRREVNKVDPAVKAAQVAAHRERSPKSERRVRKRVYALTSTERGYGWAHQKARQRYLAEMREGDPCVHCGEPMSTTDALDLDHNEDRTGYRGLAHRTCNRAVNRRKVPLPPCPICGGEKKTGKTVTCGMACGREWRRRNAA